jgi:glucuronate isomerase
MLHERRLFPAEGAARAVAVKLYETVKDLPIISPHGHTDPSWFAENKPFPNPTALFLQPDHYIFRMLYSQGISLESLGIPQQGALFSEWRGTLVPCLASRGGRPSQDIVHYSSWGALKHGGIDTPKLAA